VSTGKGWDLTSLNSLASACEWIRSGSGALIVVAVRAGAKADEDGRGVFDSAIAADPEMPIRDILPRLLLETEALTAALVEGRERNGKQHDRLSATKHGKR
jgi:hypothetical protein